MKQSMILYVGALVAAITFGVSGLALAQDKGKDAKAAPVAKVEKGKAVTKVLHDDDRVRVTETTYKPGDVSPSVVRGLRVTRTLSGATMQRTYADGKTDTFERKVGDVTVQGPDKEAYSLKNIGKTDFVIFSVNIKVAKK